MKFTVSIQYVAQRRQRGPRSPLSGLRNVRNLTDISLRDGVRALNLIVITVRNLLDDGRVDYAIQLLEDTLPTAGTIPGMGRYIDTNGKMMETLERGQWLVALACAYAERSDSEKVSELIENAAEARLSGNAQQNIVPRNGNYLMEARVLAIQGDNNAALTKLEEAVQHNLIFGWQIQVRTTMRFDTYSSIHDS